MQEHREEWEKLCQLAAVEQDPERLMELIQQINELLEAKEQRLRAKATNPRSD